MGSPKGWGSEMTGRPVMSSPGRPSVARREHWQLFWAAIARGVSSENAAVEAGVSVLVGVRWFRQGGGMSSVTQAPLSGRYLSFLEREEISIMHAKGSGCERSDVYSAALHRRSPGSFVAMPRLEAGAWDIAPRRRSGIQIVVEAPEAGEARIQRAAAPLCSGSSRRHRRKTRWD
jgi:hypothetical protein